MNAPHYAKVSRGKNYANDFMDKLFTILLLLLVLLFSGCTRLKWLDEQAGKLFFNTSTPGFLSVEKKETVTEKTEFDSENLSKEQKGVIDKWLESKGFNRYGDPKGTYYTGGTPLFNEATGVAIERYQYILGKHSELFDIIK